MTTRQEVSEISQLDRGSEQQADKRPQIRDLRESRGVEQDDDKIILLHREDAFDMDSRGQGRRTLSRRVTATGRPRR